MSSPAHLAAQTYYAPPDHLSILSPARTTFMSLFSLQCEWGVRSFMEISGTYLMWKRGHCYVLMTITNYLLVTFVYSFNLLIFRRCKYKQWNGYDYESSDTWVMCFFHTSMNHQREWNLTEILLSERLSKCAQLHLFTQCEQNRHVWNFTGRTSTP